jgi:hypothetical protein
MISYGFVMMNEKQMQIKRNLDRTKLLRHRANAGTKGGGIAVERARENYEQYGRPLY